MGSPSSFFNQFSSVTQLCPTLCDPMNRSTPGLPVHDQLLESTQTHVQLSHPLSSPSPPALNLPWHQGLFHIDLKPKVLFNRLGTSGGMAELYYEIYHSTALTACSFSASRGHSGYTECLSSLHAFVRIFRTS